MNPIPLPRHHPAPLFEAADPHGHPLALRDYRFRQDLLLALLHGPGCPHCERIAGEMAEHREGWEKWGTAVLVLQSEADPLPQVPFRIGFDPEGAVRRRYSGGGESDAVLAVIDHRGRLMEGWSLAHPAPVDWGEVERTACWVAVQEPECGACEVLPGWE